MSQMDKTYMYKSTVKSIYGLTDKMIESLGAPDKYVKNPHYRTGPSASLYLIERVEQWIEENQDWVDKARAERARRSKIATKAVVERRNKLLAWAQDVAIEVDRFPTERAKLEKMVRENKRDFLHYGRGKDVDEVYVRDMDRAIIAFLRHNYTNYHELLMQLEGKPGCVDAYSIVRERINAEIQKRVG